MSVGTIILEHQNVAAAKFNIISFCMMSGWFWWRNIHKRDVIANTPFHIKKSNKNCVSSTSLGSSNQQGTQETLSNRTHHNVIFFASDTLWDNLYVEHYCETRRSWHVLTIFFLRMHRKCHSGVLLTMTRLNIFCRPYIILRWNV